MFGNFFFSPRTRKRAFAQDKILGTFLLFLLVFFLEHIGLFFLVLGRTRAFSHTDTPSPPFTFNICDSLGNVCEVRLPFYAEVTPPTDPPIFDETGPPLCEGPFIFFSATSRATCPTIANNPFVELLLSFRIFFSPVGLYLPLPEVPFPRRSRPLSNGINTIEL